MSVMFSVHRQPTSVSVAAEMLACKKVLVRDCIGLLDGF